jgi:precorrin-6A/cobalt-precorrin-6A reductase
MPTIVSQGAAVSAGMMTYRILILGGTMEARLLTERLASRADLKVTLSLAGRTQNPVAHAVPLRSGGFGGADGLARYLREGRIGMLIDATHPYAAQISANASEAAHAAGVPIIALRRPAWARVAGDRWREVDTVADAVDALGIHPRTVFVALGRQELAPLEMAPQHAYLVRSVDPVEPPLGVPNARYLLARGPFLEEAERGLLAGYGVDTIVAKNSGGNASYGKIAAARTLGIEVILIRRPLLPAVGTVETVADAVAAVDHWLSGAKERGV